MICKNCFLIFSFVFCFDLVILNFRENFDGLEGFFCCIVSFINLLERLVKGI